MISPQKSTDFAKSSEQNLLKIETISTPDCEDDNEVSAGQAQDDDKPSEIKFACKCGKSYSRNASLFNHIRIKHSNSVAEWKVFTGMRKQGRPKKENQIVLPPRLIVPEKDQTIPSEGSANQKQGLLLNNNHFVPSEKERDLPTVENLQSKESQSKPAPFTIKDISAEPVKIGVNKNKSISLLDIQQNSSYPQQNQSILAQIQANMLSQQQLNYIHSQNQNIHQSKQNKSQQLPKQQQHSKQTKSTKNHIHNDREQKDYSHQQIFPQFQPLNHPFYYQQQQQFPQPYQYQQQHSLWQSEQQKFMKLSDNPSLSEITQHVRNMVRSQDDSLERNSIAMDTIIRFKDILDSQKDPLSDDEEIEHLSRLYVFQQELLQKYKIDSESLPVQLQDSFPFLRFWMRYIRDDKIDETLQEYIKYQFIKITKVPLDITAAMERFQRIEDDFERKSMKIQRLNKINYASFLNNQYPESNMPGNYFQLPLRSTKSAVSQPSENSDLQNGNRPVTPPGSQQHQQQQPSPPYPSSNSHYPQHIPPPFGFQYMLPPAGMEGSFIPNHHPFGGPFMQHKSNMMMPYPSSQKDLPNRFSEENPVIFPYQPLKAAPLFSQKTQSSSKITTGKDGSTSEKQQSQLETVVICTESNKDDSGEQN